MPPSCESVCALLHMPESVILSTPCNLIGLTPNIMLLHVHWRMGGGLFGVTDANAWSRGWENF